MHALRQGSLQIGWQCAGVPRAIPGAPRGHGAGMGKPGGDAEAAGRVAGDADGTRAAVLRCTP